MAVLLIAFCLTSCVEVTFPEPMPVNRKELDSFPKSWQGTWTSNEKGTDDADDEDILVIQADRVSGLEGSEDVLILGQDCVLKRLGRKRILSIPQLSGDRHSVASAERRGNTIVIRTFDAKAEGAIEKWEELIGADRMLKLYQKDNPDKKLREVQLNPKNTCQFRKLLREGTLGSRDLHEDARRPRGSSFADQASTKHSFHVLQPRANGVPIHQAEECLDVV